MKIAIGADHAGYDLKEHFKNYLQAKGHEIVDCGTDSTESIDYPPIMANVGREVVHNGCDRGIVIGGSGQGEQIAANKVVGVRAALCNDMWTARLSREHNDANVLAIGARVVGLGLAEDILDLWLATEFEGGRHERRIQGIAQIEKDEFKS